MKRYRTTLSLMPLLLAAVLVAAPAFAQETPAAPAQQPTNTTGDPVPITPVPKKSKEERDAKRAKKEARDKATAEKNGVPYVPPVKLHKKKNKNGADSTPAETADPPLPPTTK